ncbi:methyltransferase domain-containing protein [Leptolyngbya sp. NK1-12]|uniref:Protein-L-isoaspartate O-methyltransferase n=1 Tax=Leptolyngbya sp. NK1-12 TaxID=2547451 RepID=A0AA96WH77_9CYAN|nr:methyltransferase domain-containing protein [Leptolyngbya sp. NK1-12]
MVVTQHQAYVDQLKQAGWIRTPSVEAAFRRVPRHHFLPNVPLVETYQNQAIITKRLNGKSVSSSSEPGLMATMLEQLDLKPGHRVLEIGAGTGYNAALMAHIVGETGQVISIDIDEDIVEAAHQHLATAGYPQVQVVCRDGGNGYPDFAPYDRIILTVGAWDIAPAWREQLSARGRLLLPLRIKTRQVSIAFEPADNYLVSISVVPCGFMELREVLAEPDMTPLEWLPKQVWNLGLLPQPLINWIDFGRLTLEGLRIRAYPKENKYVPLSHELTIDKNWNKLVLDYSE